MTRPHQYALPFTHQPAYAEAEFLADASNAEALAWLERTPAWPGGRLAVWSEPGCGKTHLLHCWANRVDALWLDALAVRGIVPVPTRPVALDDADAIADEEALLHLLNAAAEAGQPILMASREAPARWRVALPDLASRLRALTAVRIAPPDDDMLRVLLGRLLLERQLKVPEPVQDWLRQHLPRRAGVLREAAALLDRAQFEAGRQVTRRLAEACLGPLLADTDDGPAPEAKAREAMTPIL